MEEQVINFETAKLAKDKGYFSITKSGYLKTKFINNMSGAVYNPKDYHAAPTQSLLQKWLREEYNIQFHIDYYNNSGKYGIHFQKPKTDKTVGLLYSSYEEALEEGLKRALNLI